ncbi:hypothetical protein FOZG_18154 [Fusarium oxysporum Fo47]|uniref:Uncharacterized protein n=1 Tax=Fusarium oxysporum Fo47 TaxID=660027 RepID=W9J8D7_FUSOX|nr:hypothetical protein FOZG_18154 [Fusarium oxysporum Fo47]
MPPRIHKLSRRLRTIYVVANSFANSLIKPTDTKAARLVSYGDLCVVNGQTTLTISLG